MIMTPILTLTKVCHPKVSGDFGKGKTVLVPRDQRRLALCHHKLTMYHVAPNTKGQVAKENWLEKCAGRREQGVATVYMHIRRDGFQRFLFDRAHRPTYNGLSDTGGLPLF